jgi:hypothetical protein
MVNSGEVKEIVGHESLLDAGSVYQQSPHLSPLPPFRVFFDFLQASYLFLLLQLLAGWPFQAAYFSFHM